ncbi:MAG: Asp-tRNA(Asn)/Glu-tRNA(Gln) amidotransferase subunit GatB [Candidatus Syntropharchaeia archaeon]
MDEVRIGLECHVQLNKLNSKLFCGCSTRYHDLEPNTNTCPICLGLPGALPSVNRRAVEFAIKVALALNCEIQNETLFYRKNYYYPDLPKGFQISQYDYPLAVGGFVTIDGERKIRIKRVHMEEDPGRLSYKGTIHTAKYSLVDYNRSGVPLLEIVTEPDLHSPKEARQFLNKIRSILEYLDVFDGDLEGAMRVDANISIAGGQRTEVKNISSYKGVEKALLFEITRQKNLLRRGISVKQETRHYDEVRNITISLRTKEEEQDYRYFPEPDLVPMRVSDWVDGIRETLPELPDARRERFISQYGISNEHAKALTAEIALADFYERVASEIDPILSAAWIADVLKGELNYRDISIRHFSPEDMIEILKLLQAEKITDRGAVEIIRTILDEGGTPEEIVRRKNLMKVEEDIVEKAVREVVKECTKAVDDYQSGKKEAIHYLVGQVMRKTRGRADPERVNILLRESLGGV